MLKNTFWFSHNGYFICYKTVHLSKCIIAKHLPAYKKF